MPVLLLLSHKQQQKNYNLLKTANSICKILHKSSYEGDPLSRILAVSILRTFCANAVFNLSTKGVQIHFNPHNNYVKYMK
jgi:hypothetical protein